MLLFFCRELHEINFQQKHFGKYGFQTCCVGSWLSHHAHFSVRCTEIDIWEKEDVPVRVHLTSHLPSAQLLSLSYLMFKHFTLFPRVFFHLKILLILNIPSLIMPFHDPMLMAPGQTAYIFCRISCFLISYFVSLLYTSGLVWKML